MPINIHGKEYKMVHERVAAFHDSLKPDSKVSITTEVLLHNPVLVKATVVTNSGTFTGMSAANPSKTIEAQSPYEVAETSAVGRALGFAGYGIIESIATADEIAKGGYDTQVKSEETTSLTAKCAVHRVTMRHFSKNGREWWSHQLQDGSWCNGKPQKTSVVVPTGETAEEAEEDLYRNVNDDIPF